MNTNNESPDVSIVIPSLNGGADLKWCLEMIFTQKIDRRFEVIVIDSGSTDGTIEMVHRFPVRLNQIDKRKFNHGLTRQFGVELSHGRLIVFMTQDAIPYDQNWLSHLISSLSGDKSIAGAYCRQIPKPGCDPIARTRIENWLTFEKQPKIVSIKSKLDYDSLSPWEKRIFINFDNVCSCVRKCVMEQFPFSKVAFGEDLEWSKRVLEAGYKIAYEPKSVVRHSHRSSITGNYRRAVQDHRNMNRLLGVNFYTQMYRASNVNVLRNILYGIKIDSLSIMNSRLSIFKKVYWLGYAVPLEILEKIGCVKGANSAKHTHQEKKKKMKLVIVTHDFPPEHYGGVAVYSLNLAKEFSEKSDVSVFHRRCCKSRPEYEIEHKLYEGISVTSINHNFSEKPNFIMHYQNKHVDQAFSKFLSEKMPDIVHFQFLGAGLSTGMVSVAKKFKIPTVLTLNDYWFLCPRGQMLSNKWQRTSEPLATKCARCVFGDHDSILTLEKNRKPTIDLIHAFHTIRFSKRSVKTSNPNYVKAGSLCVNKLNKQILFAHPPSEVHYKVNLPTKSTLVFDITMHPDTWSVPHGEGVKFEILARDERNEQRRLFSKYIDPKNCIADRNWHHYELDLSDLGNQTVSLLLITSPGPQANTDYATAGWGDLKIIVEESKHSEFGIVESRSITNRIYRKLGQVYDHWNQGRKVQLGALSSSNIRTYVNKMGGMHVLAIKNRNKYMQNLLNDIDILISPSRFLRDQYVKFGVPSKNIIVSDYGMDTDSVTKIKRRSSGKISFGFLGTFMPSKGLHVLVEAFKNIPSQKAVLKIYGYAPNQYHYDYLQLIKSKIDGKENIELMGRYSVSQIPTILRSIDVLVIPSIWWENSPLTIHEAFMAGIPVITSNIGGMAELVSDGINGLHFAVEDDQDLYQKLATFIEKPELVESMSINTPAIKSISANVKELIEIYRGLLNQSTK